MEEFVWDWNNFFLIISYNSLQKSCESLVLFKNRFKYIFKIRTVQILDFFLYSFLNCIFLESYVSFKFSRLGILLFLIQFLRVLYLQVIFSCFHSWYWVHHHGYRVFNFVNGSQESTLRLVLTTKKKIFLCFLCSAFIFIVPLNAFLWVYITVLFLNFHFVLSSLIFGLFFLGKAFLTWWIWVSYVLSMVLFSFNLKYLLNMMVPSLYWAYLQVCFLTHVLRQFSSYLFLLIFIDSQNYLLCNFNPFEICFKNHIWVSFCKWSMYVWKTKCASTLGGWNG